MAQARRDDIGRGNRVVAGVAVVALVALALGAAAWGISNRNDADNLRTALAGVNSDLASTKASLSTAQSDLASSRADNTQLADEYRVALAQVEVQNACLADLQSIAKDLASLYERGRVQFNMIAEGSKMASAQNADRKSLVAAIKDYYDAYSAAFDGRYSTANSWISKGNAHLDAAATALKKYNAEVAIVDKTTRQLESELTALESRITSAAITCAAAP